VKYFANDWSIELPTRFEDHTRYVFETTLRAGALAGFVVLTSKIPVGRTLREVVNARILDEAKHFNGYSVVRERDTEFPAGVAMEVCARWRHDAGTVYERQAHLQDGGVWVILSMRTPFEDRATCDAWMEHILSSLRLRGSE
jgi:hypothetical protein